MHFLRFSFYFCRYPTTGKHRLLIDALLCRARTLFLTDFGRPTRLLFPPFMCRFLSDSMGQDPLIDDEACTTRLPADVDEDAFHPESTSLPPPRPENNSGYFIQKCRCVMSIVSWDWSAAYCQSTLISSHSCMMALLSFFKHVLHAQAGTTDQNDATALGSRTGYNGYVDRSRRRIRERNHQLAE